MQIVNIILKILINFITPYIILEPYSFKVINDLEQIETEYSVNQVLTIVMNIRWFFIFQMIFKHSDYYSIKMLKIMRIHRMKYNNIFLIKLFIKKQPIWFFIFMFFLTVCLFSFVIRLCEISLAVEEQTLGFESFIITVWVVIVTLTTVGYGDYYPKTVPGRFLGFILCIWGIVEISIIVVVLFELLVLNYSESQALYLFNKLEKNKKLKAMATQSKN